MMQPFANFIDQSYELEELMLDGQKTINMFLDINETGGGRSNKFFRGTPGLKLWKETKSTGKIRGMYTDSKGYLWVVEDKEVVRYNYVPDTFIENEEDVKYLSEDLEERKVMGAIYEDADFVSFAETTMQLAIVDGKNLYVYIYADASFKQYTPSGWLGSKSVDSYKNMFVFSEPDTKKFYVSDFNDATNINALDFIEKDTTTDNIMIMKSFNGLLWAFGETSIQLYQYYADGSNTPIIESGGGTFEVGCSAMRSIQIINGTIIWAGSDKNGRPLIWASNGNSPQKISNLSVEMFIQSQDNIKDATSFVYQQNGHYFYCLNFKDANTTLCYDLTTRMWHERRYLDKNGDSSRHRAEYLVIWRNKYLVADYEKSIIYEMSLDFYTDDGNPIHRLRRSPQIFTGFNGMVRTACFQLDAVVGDIQDDFLTEPKVFLRCSKDGGNTYSSYLEKSMGRRGDFTKEIKWFNPVGAAKSVVFEVSISDPCKFTLMNVFLDTY